MKNWEIVTWPEAIQGRAEGKKVIVDVNNQLWDLVELVGMPEYLAVALEKGKWYVEK